MWSRFSPIFFDFHVSRKQLLAPDFFAWLDFFSIWFIIFQKVFGNNKIQNKNCCENSFQGWCDNNERSFEIVESLKQGSRDCPFHFRQFGSTGLIHIEVLDTFSLVFGLELKPDFEKTFILNFLKIEQPLEFFDKLLYCQLGTILLSIRISRKRFWIVDLSVNYFLQSSWSARFPYKDNHYP